MDVDKVLTRIDSIASNITPTGRKLGVVPVLGTAFVKIKFVDNKPGEVPSELNQHFTSFPVAQRAINVYLTKFWDLSDNQRKK
jgi:hypothetical protein